MPSWMQFDTPGFMKSAPAATTMQFESEPAGAEAKTSFGQTCRTPCTLEVTASEFSVSFALPGYQPQTVPVRVVTSAEPDGEASRLVPNPVFVELLPHGPPPAVAKKPAPAEKASRSPRRGRGPTAMAPETPAFACPRACLALAAGPLTAAQSADPRLAAAEGGRNRFRVP